MYFVCGILIVWCVCVYVIYMAGLWCVYGVYMCVPVCMRVCACVRVFKHVCMCMHVRACICVCVYVCEGQKKTCKSLFSLSTI